MVWDTITNAKNAFTKTQKHPLTVENVSESVLHPQATLITNQYPESYYHFSEKILQVFIKKVMELHRPAET